MPDDVWQFDISSTYTGPMIVPRVVNDDGFIELNESPHFVDVNLRVNKDFKVKEHFTINVFGGIKNMFNAYQNDFDIGPSRDSDYIYGPAAPRSVFLGVRIGG
jgi:outer membrane receptor for ferrienterochelin and colicins